MRAFVVLLVVSVVAGGLVIWLNRRDIVGGFPGLGAFVQELGLGMVGADRPAGRSPRTAPPTSWGRSCSAWG